MKPTTKQCLKVFSSVFPNLSQLTLVSGDTEAGEWQCYDGIIRHNILENSLTFESEHDESEDKNFPYFRFWPYLAGIEASKIYRLSSLFYVGCFGPNNSHYFYRKTATDLRGTEFVEILVIVTFGELGTVNLTTKTK